MYCKSLYTSEWRQWGWIQRAEVMPTRTSSDISISISITCCFITLDSYLNPKVLSSCIIFTPTTCSSTSFIIIHLYEPNRLRLFSPSTFHLPPSLSLRLYLTLISTLQLVVSLSVGTIQYRRFMSYSYSYSYWCSYSFQTFCIPVLATIDPCPDPFCIDTQSFELRARKLLIYDHIPDNE